MSQIEPTTIQRTRQRLQRQRRILLALDPSPSQRQRVANIDAALSWMRAGLYGKCSVCGCDLDAARLQEDPAMMTCPSCKSMSRQARGRLLSRPAHQPRRRRRTSTRPGQFGLVSIEDEDEVRQRQFQAAARMACRS